MKLEQFAIKLFLEYCQKNGSNGDWIYLSGSRKLVWIAEAKLFLIASIKEIRRQFKPLAKSAGQASFEIGYYQGMAAERLFVTNLLEYLEKDLDDQEKDLINKYAK